MTKHLKRILQSICLLQLPKIRDVIDRPAPSSSPLLLHDFSTGVKRSSRPTHTTTNARAIVPGKFFTDADARWWGFAPTIAACYVLWWWGAIGSHQPAIHLQCRTRSIRWCGCVVLGRTTLGGTHDARRPEVAGVRAPTMRVYWCARTSSPTAPLSKNAPAERFSVRL